MHENRGSSTSPKRVCYQETIKKDVKAAGVSTFAKKDAGTFFASLRTIGIHFVHPSGRDFDLPGKTAATPDL